MKRLVDEVIDSCDAVVNLRENVIELRVEYSVSALDDKGRQAILERALRAVSNVQLHHYSAKYSIHHSSSSTLT
jgi:hypothetical protein